MRVDNRYGQTLVVADKTIDKCQKLIDQSAGLSRKDAAKLMSFIKTAFPSVPVSEEQALRFLKDLVDAKLNETAESIYSAAENAGAFDEFQAIGNAFAWAKGDESPMPLKEALKTAWED